MKLKGFQANPMIYLTRMNHVPMVLNADLIEHIETTPDTVISLTNGQKYVVLESASDIVDKVIGFRREILSSACCAQSGCCVRAQSGLER
jgi:flagellar protein FlbD